MCKTGFQRQFLFKIIFKDLKLKKRGRIQIGSEIVLVLSFFSFFLGYYFYYDVK
jgi:hypothetical protein